ncbi:hypothetical protein [Halobacteriovorax sp.]|uniref:hypothetical protein n=1 Tax=Halobacteriovorax sp. TaxID=2020862 RepID=UPI003AF1E351
MKSLFLFTLLIFNFLAFSQSNDPVMEQLNRMREEMMKQMQATDSFDSEIQKMFQRMQKMGQIQGLPDRFNTNVQAIEYFWKDSKTLVVKVNKDDEVNIDVKEGMVVLSGMKVSKSKNSFSKFNFSQSIPIKSSLDTTSVDMKMDDGNIVLSFKEKLPKNSI